MFEQYPGQDMYNASIRGCVDRGNPEWPMDAEYGFTTVAAKYITGTETQELNLHAVRTRNQGMTILPRMMYVRLVDDSQQLWSKEQHKEHTQRLVDRLNAHVKEDRKKELPKFYNYPVEYFMDEESWITPPTKLPLDAYLKRTTILTRIMKDLYPLDTLNQEWAKMYPGEIHYWFMQGGSPETGSLGIPATYDWEKDPYVLNDNIEKFENTKKTSDRDEEDDDNVSDPDDSRSSEDGEKDDANCEPSADDNTGEGVRSNEGNRFTRRHGGGRRRSHCKKKDGHTTSKGNRKVSPKTKTLTFYVSQKKTEEGAAVKNVLPNLKKANIKGRKHNPYELSKQCIYDVPTSGHKNSNSAFKKYIDDEAEEDDLCSRGSDSRSSDDDNSDDEQPSDHNSHGYATEDYYDLCYKNQQRRDTSVITPPSPSHGLSGSEDECTLSDGDTFKNNLPRHLATKRQWRRVHEA
jgi:hypothetical protein